MYQNKTYLKTKMFLLFYTKWMYYIIKHDVKNTFFCLPTWQTCHSYSVFTYVDIKRSITETEQFENNHGWSASSTVPTNPSVPAMTNILSSGHLVSLYDLSWLTPMLEIYHVILKFYDFRNSVSSSISQEHVVN